MSRRAPSAAAARIRTALASLRKVRPSAFSTTLRPTLSNRWTPWRVSRADNAPLTADWVRFNTFAARVTCSRSATATKMRSCSSVMARL